MATLAEKWFRQGERKGRIEGKIEGKIEGRAEGKIEGRAEGKIEGRIEGLLQGIELALELKFGEKGLGMMPRIRTIRDADLLMALHEKIRMTDTPDDLLGL